MHTKNPLLPTSIHHSWVSFFSDEVLHHLSSIYKVLSDEEDITPATQVMLRFFQLDLSLMKVVILGQDPYPQKGVATGRAFEVKPLISWHQPFKNTSLRNIVRALYFMNHESNPLTFTQIKREMLNGSFHILPPNELFQHWENEGVLLLNTSFSCKIGEPASHSRIWMPFTKRLLTYINVQQPNLHWLLWGSHAREVVADLTLRNVLTSHHPMICSNREGDFLFGEVNHFRVLKNSINWGVGDSY